MVGRRGIALLLFAAASLVALAAASEAAAESAPSVPPPPTAASDAARTYFPDAILFDQHGKPLRFHTDLLEGKVVVIGAVATNCGEHCPKAFATWKEAGKKFGKRMGSEVRFIALASDPARDSEDRMRALAKSAGAGKGWYFLTGPPASLNLVLAKLDLLPKQDAVHATTWVIANVKSGLYKLGPDTMPADQLVDTVEECLDDR